MKVVIAIDSFKGSMSSLEAGDAIRRGILQADPGAEVTVRPLADGGEGTVEALTLGMGGSFQSVTVTRPLGDPVSAQYGMVRESGNNLTAIMEMSAAAGITLIPAKERNPLLTTTRGVGEMIKDAIKRGARRFIIGIGGSVTNDGGAGMLSALGYDFLDEKGQPIPDGARGLALLKKIGTEHVLPELGQCSFQIACDVTNPLCGDNGCSAVYGPQKGADPDMIRQMDGWLAAYAQTAREDFPKADPDFPGAGAAGGLGFAFLTFTNAVLESGIQIVLEETRLEDYVKDADIVVTGEGRLDSQTVMGKAPVGVAGIAKKYGKKVLAFSGSVTKDAGVCNQHGIDAYFPVLRRICTLEEAMDPQTARANTTAAAEQVFRLIGLFS